jgi:diguanylate cyclase (GGDEF)-like protein/PAS domain S-box-containing protein
MNFNAFSRNSLKTRVTLFSLVIFLFSIWSLTFYATQTLRRDMQRVLGEQQSSTATLVAFEINHELADRLDALDKVAAGFNLAALGNPALLQANLMQRPVFQDLFNGGSFITGIDGIAIASVPASAQRLGIDYSDRDYIAAALKEGKRTVGRPLIGKALNAPVIGMASPIRDDQGKVIGAVAGVTNLGAANFLDELMENHYGQTGGFVLVAPQYRLIVSATDKQRIMEPLPAPGINAMVDRHVRGDFTTIIGKNPQGVEALTSTTPIPHAGWYLAVSLPTEEAFSPLRAMQLRLLAATFFLTLIAAGLTWWMLKRQLAPVLAASKALAAATDSNQAWTPLPVARKDEVGRLIGGFNRLLAELGQREALLTQVLNTSSVAIFLVDMQGRISQANQRMNEMFGYAGRDLIGVEYADLVDPKEREIAGRNLAGVLANTIPTLELDRLYQRRDQTKFWGHLSATRFIDADATVQGLIGVIVDITDRKHSEEVVRQLAYYDPLTTLANRLLLRDRLTQAMLAGKRSGRHAALIFLDLDNFKALNDTHGHGAGDSLLVEAARRVKRCVREVDTVARFGGDEFVVLIDELSTDRAQAQSQTASLAGKILKLLAEPYGLRLAADESRAAQDIEHRCTASIGAALFLGQELSTEEVVKRADIAMYQAKEAGGNRVRFYGEDSKPE